LKGACLTRLGSDEALLPFPNPPETTKQPAGAHMMITLALQILGREGGKPERVADIIAPIWQAVLFGLS